MPNWRWNAPISEGFREITATNADPDGLVARRLGDLLAELKVSGLAVERQGRMLQLRGAQFETRDIARRYSSWANCSNWRAMPARRAAGSTYMRRNSIA